jgi:hypothetical protein
MQANFRPQLSRLNEDSAIEAQRIDRRTTRSRSADDAGTRGTPAEVLVPVIGARVKERNKARGARIRSRSTRLLVGITSDATEAKVVGVVGSTVRLGEDVIDRKVVTRDRRLRVTILAQPSRAALDDPP